MPLALQGLGDGPRSTRVGLGIRFTLPLFVGPLRAAPRTFGGLPFFRRRQVDAGTPGFRQTDGDGLLRGPRAMFSAADFFDLLADEFACLRRRRLALAFVPPRSFDSFLFRHDRLSSCLSLFATEVSP